ncbi:pyridoxamine 5'-phosphate oxidase family protein [Pseudonocardia sp. DSM 110487]|uniref:pyridoxamine 5'-phosphate oxidase family protein n=1 Tax=Pseudonocardia sp. DSM 110487 TaxID=2865833 RepID=UPI001C69D14B|nr:pyridoxamine 5'-phosphate oxidase family protein [Pseudonocardia sp. DSM 110487]QYN36999.1 pyridoxamine 5'-phosphate oxidase family protein [Pseudonocardia sp. DSM 110487]
MATRDVAFREMPAEVDAVLDRFRTGELTTFARNGTPVTVEVAPLWQRDSGRILLSTGIGLPHKAYNVRRDPRVSILYSDPTGSGLTDPPAVLVQGDATASDIVTWDDELAAHWHLIWRRQPKGLGVDPITRRVMWWYFQRIKIHIVPRRIRWWPGGDMATAPREVRVP